MRSPLGQLLLKQHLVTPNQLEAALLARTTWNTKLGSNLVRLGALDLDTLARALSLQFGVPAAFERDFRGIQPTTLSRLPRKLVEKHLAVPLALKYGHQESRVLSVAMPDPDAVAAIDELAFAAGMRVTVNVAPELRILNFLDEHFQTGGGIAIPEHPALAAWMDPSSAAVATEPYAPASDPSTWLGEALPENLESALSAAAFSWRDLLTKPAPHEADTLLLEDEVVEPVLRRIELEAPLSTTEAVGLLGLTTARDEVGDLLLRFLQGRFRCGVVFVVANGTAKAWRGFRANGHNESMNGLVLPLNVNSCLRAAYDRRAPFHGAPQREGATVHAQLWRLLRTEAPRQVLVAPILLGTRVAALVYGQSNDAQPEGSAEALGRVCDAAALALVRLSRPAWTQRG